MGGTEYSFDLPPELVAQDPPRRRGQSQLLDLERGGEVRGVRPFADLPDLLAPGDLLVCNDSRVLPARLWTRREDSGGRVELLLLQPEANPASWRALARPVRRLRPGLVLAVHDPGVDEPAGPRLCIDEVHDDGVILVTGSLDENLVEVAENHGDIPLPPYIRRDPSASDAVRRRQRDRERYQTVYAREGFSDGASVAAPTAGLHFDDALLARLDRRQVAVARVTLHVGPGTFRAPTDEQIASRRLHAEMFSLPGATSTAIASCRAAGGRVFAVGTTSLRVLETAARLGLSGLAPTGTVRQVQAGTDDPEPVFSGCAERENAGWSVCGITRLFISPPDEVTACDGLVTNFHLPGSSLLRLVAAFAGEATWRAAYREAVNRRLRFFSYGDAMIIRPVANQEAS